MAQRLKESSVGREQKGSVASLSQWPANWPANSAVKPPTCNQIEAMLFEEGRHDLNGVPT